MSTASPRTPARFLGVAGVASWFGVDAATVTKWLTRYDGWPVPDAEVEPGRHGIADRGWLPEREEEWREWRASLPGRGAPGKPKPRRSPAGEGR